MGIKTMTEALGMEFRLHMLSKMSEAPDRINAIVDQGSEGETISIVVSLGSAGIKHHPKILEARRSLQKKGGFLYVTTVAHEHSEIRQDNPSIGKQLAEQLAKDLFDRNKFEGIILTLPLEATIEATIETDGYLTRRTHFEDNIKDLLSQRNFTLDKLDLERGFMFDLNAAERTAQKVIEYLNGPNGNRVVAIYSQTILVTLGALRGIVKHNADSLNIMNNKNDICVYSDYISPSLLRWLRDDKWPLMAICGAEPHAYGMLTARVAASQHEEQSYQHIVPAILIPKSMARQSEDGKRTQLTYLSELPDRFPNNDIELLGRKFCWKDWMEGEAKNLYGPAILDRRMK